MPFGGSGKNGLGSPGSGAGDWVKNILVLREQQCTAIRTMGRSTD